MTQKPLPVLTDLHLSSIDEIAPVLHEDFLGESVPRLREMFLHYIALPALLKFALSATHLSELSLWAIDIKMTGYAPEAIATCLATFPSLVALSIGFESPRSRPDQIGMPPPTRAVLPTLTYFVFKGVNEYLEVLIARIDTPKLNKLIIRLMYLMFHIPHLHEFITSAKRIRVLNSAEVTFSSSGINIVLRSLSDR